MSTPSNTSSGGIDCRYPILGWSTLRLTLSEIAGARKARDFFPPCATAIALKHCEDQTIAALAAVFAAVRRCGLTEVDFKPWSIVAAPRFFGRSMVSHTLDRFAIDGAWGVSMQFIPNAMQHSQASSLSLALGAQGVAIGAGGGPESERSGALAAFNVLQRERSPGTWLVWTGWEPEYVVEANRQGPLGEPVCLALALAIGGAAATRPGSAFRVYTHEIQTANIASSATPPKAAASLLSLACHGVDSPSDPISLISELGGGLVQAIELHPPAAGASAPLSIAAARHDASFSTSLSNR